MFRGCQVACIGFTFTKDSPLNQIGRLGDSLRTEFAEETVNTTIVDDVPCPTCPELKVILDFLD